MKAYTENLFSFQNKASCFAAVLGEPKLGHLVYEMGVRLISKTLYLAQLMDNAGKIISMDPSARRLGRLKLEAEKAGVKTL